MAKKITYTAVRQQARAAGYLLLTPKEQYLNTRQKLTFQCPRCQSPVVTVVGNLSRMKGCKRCVEKDCPLTPDQQAEVIRLYTVEKRGKKFIGTLFGRSDGFVSFWLKRWGVPNHPHRVICQKLREVYGPTKGFKGHSHSCQSKNKTSESLKDDWAKGQRRPTLSKSSTYCTVIGNVLGRWEVSYLQRLLEQQKPLPSLGRTRYQTPHGSYMPDFEYPDRFVEVKSPWTLAICKGEKPSKNNLCSDLQWRKIQYVNDHFKSVEVVVLTKAEAARLFANAQTGVLQLSTSA